MSAPVISVRSLTKSFQPDFWVPATKALDSVTFDVLEGRVTGFVGFNGSGKTTTLKSILGFISPDSGIIELFSGASRDKFRSRIGYLPERPYYLDFLTATEYMKHHWELSAQDSDNPNQFERKCDELLHLVGLEESRNRKLKTFSKGMLQRIGIAQSLLRDPDLLIFDEPMSGLDPDGRDLVRSLIFALKEKGKTVFFSSHLLSDMILLCDDIVALHKGKVIYAGGLPELLKEDATLVRAEVRSAQALERKFQAMIAEAFPL